MNESLGQFFFDFLQATFDTPKRSLNIEKSIGLSLEEFYYGCKKKISYVRPVSMRNVSFKLKFKSLATFYFIRRCGIRNKSRNKTKFYYCI